MKNLTPKSFFPNFQDPVPPNHSLTNFYQPPSPVQSETITSSDRPMTPEISAYEYVDETTVITVDRETQILLLVFFSDLCPNTIFKSRGCLNTECTSSHTVPEAIEFEGQLLKNTITDAENTYKYVWTFPEALRNRFLPAFARVYAIRKQKDLLENLIRDCPMQRDIVDAMVRGDWKRTDAVQFAIDHHTDTSQLAREEILKAICTTGSEIVKFADYLEYVRN